MRRLLSAASIAALLLAAVPASAATDAEEDTEFLFRLGMLQGHLMVGHDLLKAGKTKLALPHFGHPVRELYDDVKDYLNAKKAEPFDTALIDLEASATRDPDGAETEAKYQAVIGDIEKARDTVPAPIRQSVPTMIEVCADTIDAAAGEYGEAMNKGRIDDVVEYHDSRGFISYVQQEVAQLSAAHSGDADAGLIGRFKTVLAKAGDIVSPLIPPETPKTSVSDYRAIAEQARAVAKP